MMEFNVPEKNHLTYQVLSSPNISLLSRRATENDREQVLQCIRRSFLLDSPLNKYFNILSEENEICEEYENKIMECMENPSWNFVAIQNNKIVGVMLNKSITKHDYYLPPNNDQFKNKKYDLLRQFMHTVSINADLFGKYPDCDEAFVMAFGCIDEEFRRNNFGVEAVLSSMKLAKELGYKLVKVNCTSMYSAAIYKKLGFDLIYTLNYDNYKINNEFVIKATPPHTCIEVFAKRL